MSDKPVTISNLSGSIATVGDVKGNISNEVTNSFNQSANQMGDLNYVQLADELAKLREAMTPEVKSSEQAISLGKVAEAEQAAKNKDKSKLFENLKAAGTWALDIATKIGLQITGEYIKQAMGK